MIKKTEDDYVLVETSDFCGVVFIVKISILINY